MSVDLPAPLSPSTHVTAAESTWVVMSFRAMMLPKYFPTPRSSMSGGAVSFIVSPSCPRVRSISVGTPCAPAADGLVRERRHQEDDAEEQEVEVVVPAGERDSLRRHAEDEAAKSGTDRRPEPAREQAAAEHRSDDEVELVAH